MSAKDNHEFETYRDAVQLIRDCRPIWEAIGRFDRDLMRQMRKCVTSVPLNIGEGGHRRGGHRRERLDTAYGSCREVKAVIDAAEAAGYIEEGRGRTAWRRADSICARLYRTTHR